MSLMRSLGDIVRPQLELKWSKAQVGAVIGTVAVPAAHCLPCQLWIDNTTPWDLVHSALVDRGKLSKILKEEIFGHETILPSPFNLADSSPSELPSRLPCRGLRIRDRPHEAIAATSGVLKRSGDGTILLKVEDRPGAANAGI